MQGPIITTRRVRLVPGRFFCVSSIMRSIVFEGLPSPRPRPPPASQKGRVQGCSGEPLSRRRGSNAARCPRAAPRCVCCERRRGRKPRDLLNVAGACALSQPYREKRLPKIGTVRNSMLYFQALGPKTLAGELLPSCTADATVAFARGALCPSAQRYGNCGWNPAALASQGALMLGKAYPPSLALWA